MDVKYKVHPKKIERLRDRQTALLNELDDLMMQQFAGEPKRWGADYDPLDDVAATWHIANAALAKAREELDVLVANIKVEGE